MPPKNATPNFTHNPNRTPGYRGTQPPSQTQLVASLRHASVQDRQWLGLGSFQRPQSNRHLLHQRFCHGGGKWPQKNMQHKERSTLFWGVQASSSSPDESFPLETGGMSNHHLYFSQLKHGPEDGENFTSQLPAEKSISTEPMLLRSTQDLTHTQLGSKSRASQQLDRASFRATSSRLRIPTAHFHGVSHLRPSRVFGRKSP